MWYANVLRLVSCLPAHPRDIGRESGQLTLSDNNLADTTGPGPCSVPSCWQGDHRRNRCVCVCVCGVCVCVCVCVSLFLVRTCAHFVVLSSSGPTKILEPEKWPLTASTNFPPHPLGSCVGQLSLRRATSNNLLWSRHPDGWATSHGLEGLRRPAATLPKVRGVSPANSPRLAFETGPRSRPTSIQDKEN